MLLYRGGSIWSLPLDIGHAFLCAAIADTTVCSHFSFFIKMLSGEVVCILHILVRYEIRQLCCPLYHKPRVDTLYEWFPHLICCISVDNASRGAGSWRHVSRLRTLLSQHLTPGLSQHPPYSINYQLLNNRRSLPAVSQLIRFTGQVPISVHQTSWSLFKEKDITTLLY